MEESGVPFCSETENKAEACCSTTIDSATLERATATQGKDDVSDNTVWNISKTAPGHLMDSHAKELGSDLAGVEHVAGITEEELGMDGTYSGTFSSGVCETPRSSDCYTDAIGGDSSTALSCSDTETVADQQVPALSQKRSAFSSETSEYTTAATAGDSTDPSCSDTEADGATVADHQLPVDVIQKKCSRLEAEVALSLAVFAETCESLSRSNERRTNAAAAGDSAVPSWSDVDESEQFQDVSMYDVTVEGARKTEESGEGWVTDMSTMSPEKEEGVWKEIRHGRRRSLTGSKQSVKKLPRVALVTLFDAVDSFAGDAGSGPLVITLGARGTGRGSGNFSSSRRCGPSSRASDLLESRPPDEALTEADVWASKHVMATLEAIASRLENMERCVLSDRGNVRETSEAAMAQYRLQLQEMEKRMAGVMSLGAGVTSLGAGEQRSRLIILQAKTELLVRRLLRMRETLQAGSGGGGGEGGFTELDVQMALAGARRHLRTAQGAAAKLSSVLADGSQG